MVFQFSWVKSILASCIPHLFRWKNSISGLFSMSHHLPDVNPYTSRTDANSSSSKLKTNLGNFMHHLSQESLRTIKSLCPCQIKMWYRLKLPLYRSCFSIPRKYIEFLFCQGNKIIHTSTDITLCNTMSALELTYLSSFE